jgi:uncharacterized RDD family membrane protein YckC
MMTTPRHVLGWAAASAVIATVMMAGALRAQESSSPASERPGAAVQSDQPATRGRTVGPRAGGRAGETVGRSGEVSGRSAQPAPGPAPSDTPFGESSEQIGAWRNTRPVVRIGQDYTVPAGTTVSEVVVIMGSLVIEGRVERDVVVVAGTLRMGPDARVGGDMVVVASRASVAEGAVVERDLAVVGGPFEAPPTFSARGEHVVVGTTAIGSIIEGVIPWATQGLLLGRLIVPSLGWMWFFVGVVAFVYLVLGLLFERAVRACTEPLYAKPLSTFLVGLLVYLLFGPVIFILAVSVVGIIVIPFAICALFVAGLFGRVAVARAIGGTVLAESTPGDKLEAARSFVIGFAILVVAYMVPILGIVTYMLVGVFGMGAASMALFAALRRENPARPKPPRPLPAVPPAPVGGMTPAPEGGYSSGGSAATAFSAEAPSAPTTFDHVSSAGAAVPVVPPSASAAALLSMPKASFLIRAAAFFIDAMAVLLAVSMFGDVDSPRPYFFLLLVYHVVFWTLKGTTLGGILCNLRVIRTDGMPLTFGDALIRGLSSILSLVVLFLGALWILIDRDRQSWHDRLAGTYVVVVPKEWAGVRS